MFSRPNLKHAAVQLQKTFTRGKRSNTNSPSTQRVVNQLSALSASRKQPKLLKLCAEDLVKHNTITNAWNVFTRHKNTKMVQQLEKQFESIRQAMDELKAASPELYAAANEDESKKRFPLDMRVPTDYPAKSPWVRNFDPSKRK